MTYAGKYLLPSWEEANLYSHMSGLTRVRKLRLNKTRLIRSCREKYK